VIDADTMSSACLVATGPHDEPIGEAYAVIDGADGRAQHVRLRGIEAFADAPPAGAILEARRFGDPMIPGRPGDAHEDPDGPAQGRALADEGGSEDGNEHRVLIRPSKAPVV
jgi:hypothetical protein